MINAFDLLKVLVAGVVAVHLFIVFSLVRRLLCQLVHGPSLPLLLLLLLHFLSLAVDYFSILGDSGSWHFILNLCRRRRFPLLCSIALVCSKSCRLVWFCFSSASLAFANAAINWFRDGLGWCSTSTAASLGLGCVAVGAGCSHPVNVCSILPRQALPSSFVVISSGFPVMGTISSGVPSQSLSVRVSVTSFGLTFQDDQLIVRNEINSSRDMRL
ncbi:hypothetical protein Q3G72_027609 [Acer saccharum]|nr:hypothetical protein Q3G72_027609 [Acer saccharum]